MSQLKVYDKARDVRESKVGVYRLIARFKESEIYVITLYSGRSIVFSPYSSSNTESLYVVKGKLYYVNEDQVITEGMQVVIRDLAKAHHFIVLEDTDYIQVIKTPQMKAEMDLLEKASSLIRTIGEKDNYTETHCDRTGNLAVGIATLMNLAPKKIQHLLYAAKLHDIGKINILDEILNKPSALNDAEYSLIKTHPYTGKEIILKFLEEENKTETRDLFENVADIIHQHHEKCDGSGYPLQLHKDQIRIEAKILFVADSYDAMTSLRCYKNAKSHNEAIDELKAYSDKWYEREMVETLELLLSRLSKVQSKIRT